MFNALYPNVYRKLRERAGLTQAELGKALGINRYTVNKVESGRAQLDREQEEILLELAKCNREEFGELVCEELSELLDKRVGISSDHGAYQATTSLAKAFSLLREHESRIPAAMRRALNNRISTTQLLGLAFDKNNADLVELTQDCREQLRKDSRKETMTTRSSHAG